MIFIIMSQHALRVATLQKIELLGDEYLVEFINDTMSFYIRQVKAPFISKYAQALQGAYNIVPVREFLVELIKLALRKSHRDASLDDYKAVLQEKLEAESLEISQKTIDIMSASIYGRREEMRKILT